MVPGQRSDDPVVVRVLRGGRDHVYDKAVPGTPPPLPALRLLCSSFLLFPGQYVMMCFVSCLLLFYFAKLRPSIVGSCI